MKWPSFAGLMSGGGTSEGGTIRPDDNATVTQYHAPMQLINGCETRATNRLLPADRDHSPYMIRRFTNMSVTDVQLGNGLARGVASGKRIGYGSTGWLNNIVPQIPGQTRMNAAGSPPKGPSPYTIQDIFRNGPGSQPEHPGGPGKIAGTTLVNPMTG